MYSLDISDIVIFLAGIPITNLLCKNVSSIGLPDAVSNLKSENLVHAIHLTWEAPPSLDITSVDPDIWYRVDITVNGTSDIILSNCSNVPEFIYHGTNTSVIYMFQVTPINGAGNGATSAPVTGYFIGREYFLMCISYDCK